VLVNFIGAVSFRASMQDQQAFNQIEDKESRHHDAEDKSRAPALRRGNGQRLRQEIEKDRAQQNACA
jgi:hypothetical protein